jgi:hypothetical protein
MNRRRICYALITLVAAVTGLTRADVPEDSVVVKVGQEVFVSFTANGDSLRALRRSRTGTVRTPLTIQVTQSGPTRTLLITNGFSRSLGCCAKTRKRGSRKELELPVSSVRSGMQSVTTLG